MRLSDGGGRLDSANVDGLRAFGGADFVDVGGESTRPGAQPTLPEEELRRVLPVIEGLAAKNVIVSVDTRRASVARACLDAGARVVNDVSALRDDAEMLPLVAERRVPVVLVHRRGRSEDKYEGPAYRDVVEDVRAFLLERAAACEAAGVAHDRIALDPGIGFGKSVEEKLALIEGVAPRHGDRCRGLTRRASSADGRHEAAARPSLAGGEGLSRGAASCAYDGGDPPGARGLGGNAICSAGPAGPGRNMLETRP